MTDQEFQALDERAKQNAWDNAFWDTALAPAYAVLNPTHNQPSANTEEARVATAAGVRAKGYAIDVPIMIWGWSPWYCAIERQRTGEDFFSPERLPPPFIPPPPPPLPETRCVGSAIVGWSQRYNCLPAGLLLHDGDTRTQDGKTYRKRVEPGLMAQAHTFELV